MSEQDVTPMSANRLSQSFLLSANYKHLVKIRIMMMMRRAADGDLHVYGEIPGFVNSLDSGWGGIMDNLQEQLTDRIMRDPICITVPISDVNVGGIRNGQ